MFRHLLLIASLIAPAQVLAAESPLALREVYARQVDRQLAVPTDEQRFYAKLLAEKLHQAGLQNVAPQYVVLVDRSPQVQALLLYWVVDGTVFELIGASPVSTGKPGKFDYFETPTGVFDHSIAHFDFRAEGTKNSFGIMGYGVKGMRVFDFGWVRARRTWIDGEGEMRLLIHATDPNRLEPRLGTLQSKGCIRIPASLNRLFDYYGILDAHYESETKNGTQLWVLRPDRKPTYWPGRYLVVVDSNRSQRPTWSPLPVKNPPSSANNQKLK